jgi:hypothetical protein
MKTTNRARCVVLACALTVSGVAVGANGVQARHDDFVRRPGDPKIPASPPTIVIPARAHYLLKNVVMTSSTPPNDGDPVVFGPFTNQSPYTVVISLTHVGGNGAHSATGVVNGVAVNSSSYAATFEVPPGSSYSLSIQDSHTVSAWVVGSFDESTDFWKMEVLPKFGLPTAQDFINPVRLNPVYIGCVNVVNNAELQGTEYYYQGGQWTDKANAVGDYVYTPEFGYIIPGSKPAQPVQCAQRDVTQSNDSDNGGGGGPGDAGDGAGAQKPRVRGTQAIKKRKAAG